MSQHSASRGFTLIEMMICVTLLALVAGALVPVIVRPYVAEYQIEVTNEMAAIQAGILGHPEKGNFGFLGDFAVGISGNTALATLAQSSIGGTPPGLQSLLTQGSLPAASVGSAHATPASAGVVSGWNGPYVIPHFPQPITDPWGNYYIVETGTVFGQPATEWRLRSAGPDRAVNTADDIVFPTGGTSCCGLPSQGNLLVDLWKTTGGGSTFGANQATYAQGTPQASTGGGVGEWPVTQSDLGTGWTVTLSPATAPCTQPAAATNPNWYLCESYTFGNHHLRVVNQSSVVLLDQNVIVNTPSAYVRPFVTMADSAVILPGATSGAATASTTCDAPAAGAPVGSLCMAKSTDFTSTLQATAAPYFSGMFTYSGVATIATAKAECTVQAYLDTNQSTPSPVAIGSPVYVSGPAVGELVNFILSVPVTLPNVQPNNNYYWKLYVASTQTSSPTTACSSTTWSAVSVYSSQVQLLGHP